MGHSLSCKEFPNLLKQNTITKLCSQIVSDRVCIDIRVTSLHDGASWTYGPCAFAARNNQENNNITLYVEKCCLSEEENTLTCRDYQKRGWRGEYLEIQGHKHCHDFFSGYTAKRKITVLGMQMNSRIEFFLQKI